MNTPESPRGAHEDIDAPVGPLDGPAPAQAVVAFAAADAAAIPPLPTQPTAVTLPTTPRRATASLLALSLAAFLVVTNEIAPLGLMDRIAEDLGRSRAQVGFLITAFALTVMVASVPLARLTTSWKRKPVVVSALGVWVLGTTVTFMSQGFAQLLIGRGITGLGHALFWSVATPAVAGMFAPEVRGRCVSRLLLGASAAGVVGLPLTMWLAQQTSWRTPLMVIAGGGAVLAVVIAFVMPSFRTTEGTAARGQYPNKGRYLRVVAVTFLSVSSLATTFTFITPFFVDVSQFAEKSVPALLAAGGTVGMFSMWLVGTFLDRYPVRSVAFGMGMLTVVWAGFFALGSIKAVAVIMMMAHGFAWSILVASLINWAIRHTPWATDIGVAFYNSTFNAGNAVGSVLGGALLGWFGARWLPGVSMVILLVAAVLVWQVRPLVPTLARLRARKG